MSGQNQNRPFTRPSSTTSTPERPASPAETREAPKKPAATLDDYGKKAEKVKSEPNKEAAEAIRKLDGTKPTASQLEGLTALNSALTSVLTKLSKKGVDISKIRTTEDLKREVVTNGLQLSLPEAAAVENLDRVASQPGETAREIKQSWPDRIETAKEASKGYGTKYMDYLKSNPVGTIALSIAGIAGIYLSYQGIKSLAKKATGIGGGDKDKGSSWFKKEIAIPLVIMGAGAVIGKDTVAKMLADAGLDYFKVEDKVRKAEEFTEDERKRLGDAGKRIQQKVDEEKAKKAQPPAAAEPATSEGAETPTPAAPVAPVSTPVQEAEEGSKPGALRTKADTESGSNEMDEQTKEALIYSGPRDLLIESYIYLAGEGKEFSPIDIQQIERSIDKIRGKKISEIQAFWEKNKDNKPKTIPRVNSLGTFDDDATEENIYVAIEIVANSAEQYQKHSKKEDISNLSLEQFFAKHINNDHAQKVSRSVQRAFISAIEHGDITDLTKLNDVSLEEMDKDLEKMGVNAREELVNDFGIDLNGVNKKEFGIMVGFLEQYGDLVEEDADKAFSRIAKFPRSSDARTNEAIKTFYSKIRERTVKQIIPAAVDRFNLDKDFVSNAANADIIKKHLNNQIAFKRAFYLCVVTKSIDLSKPSKDGSSPPQELAFLFTVLGSIPKPEKQKYISELSAAMTKNLDKLPSLAVLKPYISMVGTFAISHVKKKIRGLGYWASAFMPNRSEEDQEKFLGELRNKPFWSLGWVGEGAKEATGGSLEIAWDFITPFIESGKVTLEEIGHCEGPIDFMQLAYRAGATFMFAEDEKGEPIGMMHFMGDVFVCRPSGILWETLKGLKDGDFGGAIKVWTVGSAPFVAYGAVHGGLMAYWSNGGWQKGRVLYHALKGGGKMGLGYPYYALRTAGRAASRAVSAAVTAPIAAKEYGWRRPIGTAKRVGRGTADLFRYRSPWPGQNVPNMLENGKWFEKYSEGSSKIKKLTLKQKLHYLSNDPKVLITRLGEGFNTSMSLRYASRFAQDYNDFFQFQPASSQRLNWVQIMEGNGQEIGKVQDRITKMRTFLQGIESYDPIFDDMRAVAKSGLQGDELEKAMVELIKKMKGNLEPDELKSLAKQMLSEKDVTNLQRRMKDGLEAIKRENAAAAATNEPGRMKRLLDRIRKKPAGEPAEPDSAPKAAEPGAEPAPEPTPEPAAAKPRPLGRGKYSYRGEEIKITEADIRSASRNLRGPKNARREQAIQDICEARWQKSFTQLRQLPTGERVFRFRGMEFTLTADECLNRASKLAALEAQYTAATQAAAAASPAPDSGAAGDAGSAAKTADAASETAEGGPSRLRRAGQHFLGETLHSAGGSEAVLNETTKALDEWRPKAVEANKTLQEIADARAAGKDLGDASKVQERIDAARRTIAVESELEATANAVRTVKTTEEALKAAKAAKNLAEVAKLEQELRTGTLVAEDAMRSSGKALEAVSRLGKVGTAFKTGFRVAGGGLAVFGAGVSAYSAISSFGEAWSTDVKGRKGLKYGESAMWAASTAVDALAVAGMVGAEGWAVSAGSYAAAPLAPIFYAGSKVFETLNEDTKTSAEWMQGDSRELLRHFYTTMNSCALGDAWISSVGLEKSRIKNQRESMHRIFRALIALQKDKGEPSLISIMQDPKIEQKEKDRMIEARIKGNFSRYHEFYFNEAMVSGVQSYADAQRFIQEAQMFDDIMQKRDEAKKKGQTFTLIGKDKSVFNLHLERYDITDDGKIKPEVGKQFNPSHVVQAYKETIVKLFEQDPVRKMNLDRMDSGYLLMIYMQIGATLQDKDPQMKKQLQADKGLAEDLYRQAKSIELYLETARGINMKFVGEYSKPEPRWSLKEIDEHLTGIGSVTNETYLKYEKKEYQMTPALNALYKLGEYFGYEGPPKEDQLKLFFKKEAASGQGLYWDGSEWMLQERGYEFDDSFGSELNSNMIEKIIERMKEQPDNILEHRNDSVFLDAHDYSNEVMKMAKVLEDGLAMGNQRGYEGRRESEKEKGAHVEYSKPKEDLTKNYQEAIEYTKTQGNWSQLDYTINNENSITMKRKDGNATIELTRTGTTWKVGDGYKEGLTLMQAVTLGNLINNAKQWVASEKIEGASERPFEIDGDRIDFDVNWSAIDQTLPEGWMSFYGEIGISKEMVVDVLNTWYYNDIRKRTSDVGFFE